MKCYCYNLCLPHRSLWHAWLLSTGLLSVSSLLSVFNLLIHQFFPMPKFSCMCMVNYIYVNNMYICVYGQCNKNYVYSYVYICYCPNMLTVYILMTRCIHSSEQTWSKKRFNDVTIAPLGPSPYLSKHVQGYMQAYAHNKFISSWCVCAHVFFTGMHAFTPYLKS